MVLSPAQKLRPAVLPTPWALDEVAGRLVEISGSTASSALTITFSLVREAQRHGEPVGWVTSADSFFYPPDVARGGTDLSALAGNRIAVTPLRLDLTDEPFMTKLAGVFS